MLSTVISNTKPRGLFIFTVLCSIFTTINRTTATISLSFDTETEAILPARHYLFVARSRTRCKASQCREHRTAGIDEVVEDD